MANRRTVLTGTAAAAAGLLVPTSSATAAADGPRGRVKQSVAFWCFNSRGDKWSADKTCEVAAQLGCQSVELIGPEHWATVAKHGLVCAIASNGMPGAPFMRGLNNARFHAEVIDRTSKTMDLCAEAKVPSVIAFVGYKWTNPDDPKSAAITPDDAFANCVKGLKELARHAEKRRVTVCLEHLNTRDDSDPMKGHPGYQGDDLDFVASVIRKVGSPRVKLLFDVYHVQVMHGDLIRRIEECKDVIGHIHTAGNPGRAELDDNQEIHYPPIMRKLLDIDYKGCVGHEFIPTRDPAAGLRQAVQVCDV